MNIWAGKLRIQQQKTTILSLYHKRHHHHRRPTSIHWFSSWFWVWTWFWKLVKGGKPRWVWSGHNGHRFQRWQPLMMVSIEISSVLSQWRISCNKWLRPSVTCYLFQLIVHFCLWPAVDSHTNECVKTV